MTRLQAFALVAPGIRHPDFTFFDIGKSLTPPAFRANLNLAPLHFFTLHLPYRFKYNVDRKHFDKTFSQLKLELKLERKIPVILPLRV